MKRFFSPRTDALVNGREHALVALEAGATAPVDGTAMRLGGESIGSGRTDGIGAEVS